MQGRRELMRRQFAGSTTVRPRRCRRRCSGLGAGQGGWRRLAQDLGGQRLLQETAGSSLQWPVLPGLRDGKRGFGMPCATMRA